MSVINELSEEELTLLNQTMRESLNEVKAAYINGVQNLIDIEKKLPVSIDAPTTLLAAFIANVIKVNSSFFNNASVMEYYESVSDVVKKSLELEFKNESLKNRLN